MAGYEAQLQRIISHNEGELRLAVARQSEYREKLKGASPDQAASTIAHLEDELAVLHTASIPASISKENVWPPLTPSQIASMSEMLRRYSVSSFVIFFVDQNSESFCGSLYEVFSRALWPPPSLLKLPDVAPSRQDQFSAHEAHKTEKSGNHRPPASVKGITRRSASPLDTDDHDDIAYSINQFYYAHYPSGVRAK